MSERVWAYHGTCPEGKVFETSKDVPKGWVDSPAKIKTRKRPKTDDE
ncbi:MAG: hypothetical protein ACPGGK_16390 [Pikeienuella sp.]